MIHRSPLRRSLRDASLLLGLGLSLSALQAAEVTGTIRDADSGEKIPARLTIVSKDGKQHFLAETTGREGLGAAVPYEKKRGESIEIHTALSPDPFRVDLPPGTYSLTATRGHEYRPATVEIELPENDEVKPVELELQRWIDLNQRGWFSGDVHCHLPRKDLETVMQAADLNVTFPLAGWVTDTTHQPDEHSKTEDEWPTSSEVYAGTNRAYWARNTEYELFTHDGEKHPLGALLVLRHREPLDLTVPPIKPMIETARAEGAVFDLEKHNWPWSMVLPAIDAADLFELSNNHVWETTFGVKTWYTEFIPNYMQISVSEDGEIEERGWLDFGFQNWYALLNCGLKLSPSAGTGAGVHPVALGFGRVYVSLPGGEFDFDEWVDGLKAGRSFVTTGPMLFLTAAEQHPGGTIEWDPDSEEAKGSEEEGDGVPVIVRVECERPIESLELVVNGEVVPLEIGGPIGAQATHSAMARVRVDVERSSWITARVFTKTEDGRPRFAHTAPIYVDVKGKPLRPRTLETNYLVDRVKNEIERHQGVLSDEALEEFEEALEFYEAKLKEAVDADE